MSAATCPSISGRISVRTGSNLWLKPFPCQTEVATSCAQAVTFSICTSFYHGDSPVPAPRRWSPALPVPAPELFRALEPGEAPTWGRPGGSGPWHV